MVEFTKQQIADIIREVGRDSNSTADLESAMKKVMATLKNKGLSAAGSGENAAVDFRAYPLGEKRPDLVKSATGMGLDDITLDRVVSGNIKFEDIKTRPETLDLQVRIAESVNRPRLADNLRRAGEMTRIPDERLLEMYNFLRPYRATKQELLDMAEELETRYQATTCAGFVREAAAVYEKNQRLKGDL